MRDDEIDLPGPPGNDRPGDRYLPEAHGDSNALGNAAALTWSGKCRRWTWFTLAIFAAAGLLTLFLVPSASLLKPGPLSKPHAQILAGTVLHKRCASCHSDASLSPLSLFSSESDPHSEMSQTQLCLDCHQKTITPNLATAAHNLPLSVRDDLTRTIQLASQNAQGSAAKHQAWIPDPAVDQNSIQCSACHKEHHGVMVDLTAMSSAQCQTCHEQRFDRFAGSHPDWDRWPYGRGGEIAFDHGSHSSKHFQEATRTGQAFDCTKCHGESDVDSKGIASANGELLRSASYESSCASCHDDSLRVQLSSDVEFVSLPMVPEVVASTIPGWPESAIGFADGRVSPLLELLLRSDDAVANTLRRIPEGELGRLSSTDSQTDNVVKLVAKEIQKLFTELSRDGHASFENRLVRAGVSPNGIGPLLRSFAPQLVESAKRHWKLGDAPPEMTQASRSRDRVRLVLAADDDLLVPETQGGLSSGEGLLEPSDSLLGGTGDDDLLMPVDPLSITIETSPRKTSPSDLVSKGGWYRDDAVLAIRYRASQHADEVMVSLIELFSQLSSSDPLKERFFKQPAVAACVSCHRSADAFPAAWRAEQKIGRRTEFTKFSHRPHLNVSALGDCRHCHQVNLDDSASDFVNDFEPLGRQSCAACHTAKAAGEACTQCHRYHLDW